MSKDESMGRGPASLGPHSVFCKFFGFGPKMCAGKYKRGRLDRESDDGEEGGKMVLVQVKSGVEEEELQLEFLYECPSSSTIDDVAESVADIHRLQSKILLSLSPFVRTRLLTRAFPGTAAAADE